MSKVEQLRQHLAKTGVDVEKFHGVNSQGRWVFLKDMDEEMAGHMLEVLGHIEDGWHMGWTDDQTWRGKLFNAKETVKMYARVYWKKLMTRKGMTKFFNWTYYPSWFVWGMGMLLKVDEIIVVGMWATLCAIIVSAILAFFYMKSPIENES